MLSRITGRPWFAAGVLRAWLALAPATVLADATAFDPELWLKRVQRAASTQSYQGTMIFSGGGIVSSSRVSHLSQDRQRYERIDVLGGPPRQQFRHNDVVLTLWPQSRVAVFEPQLAATEFPSLPMAGQRMLERYELRLIGRERIAGREADVVMVKPRDALRFAQRLWAERDSGLLLRADVLGPRGELLESTAFIDLTLDDRLPVESVLGPMRQLDGYRVMHPQAQRIDLEAEGWMLQGPPGFRLVSCARRSLVAIAPGADARPVVQAVFSDGLAHVSVFIEPYDAQRHRPLRSVLGATHTLMNRHGPSWITVVGDVPMSTVDRFDAGLQRR